jgi:hypothetical protein
VTPNAGNASPRSASVVQVLQLHARLGRDQLALHLHEAVVAIEHDAMPRRHGRQRMEPIARTGTRS